MKKIGKVREKHIREHLFRMVDNQILKRGETSLMEFQRKHPSSELFPAPLCPFANRLCPDDLCYLPAGHIGTEESFHITGTVAYDYAVRWEHSETDMQLAGTSRQRLIEAGNRLQWQERVAEAMGEDA